MAHVLTPLLLVPLAQGVAMAVGRRPFTLESRTRQDELRSYDSVVVAETRIEVTL